MACQEVYEEALPLFYSETFFAISGDVNTTVSWLSGIGAQRRRYIRKLSLYFDSAPILQPEITGIQESMRAMSEILTDANHVDVLELLMFDKLHEGHLSLMANHINYRISRYTALRKPGKPLLLHGIEQLERLPWLGCLRIVGLPELLLRFPEDKAYLEAFCKRQDTCWTWSREWA